MFKNLMRIIQRVEKRLAPIHIVEIWGFGSYFRGKPEPGDIDLVIVYRKDPKLDGRAEQFRLFIAAMDRTSKGRESLSRLTADPNSARKFAQKHYPGLPVEVWLRHVKVTDSFLATYLHYRFHPTDTAKKVLKEGVRFVQISDMVPTKERDDLFKRMPVGKYTLVWSESRRDVASNLKHADAKRFDITIEELHNFKIQTERYRSQYQVILNTVRWIIGRMHSSQTIADDFTVRSYLERASRRIKINTDFRDWIVAQFVTVGSYPTEPDLKLNVTGTDIDRAIDDIVTSSEAGTVFLMCESMRGEIDLLKSKCAVASYLLSEIIAKDNDSLSVPISRKIEHAVYRTFLDVPKYKADDDMKRRVMKEIGLERISRRLVLFDWVRPDYHLAVSEKDLRELRSKAREIGLEKEYTTYLRSVVRKTIPKGIEISISVLPNKPTDRSLLPSIITIGLSTEENDLDTIRRVAKKYGVVIFKRAYGYYASLPIDVSDLRGNKVAIRRFVASKLR